MFVISTTLISGIEILDFGWKHITLQTPCAEPIWNKGSLLTEGLGTFGKSAGKSLSNTNVDS